MRLAETYDNTFMSVCFFNELFLYNGKLCVITVGLNTMSLICDSHERNQGGHGQYLLLAYFK